MCKMNMINMESVAKMQKSDAETVVVNIVLLIESPLGKGKPEMCTSLK